MAFAKFEGNWFRADGEIAENYAILVILMASTIPYVGLMLDQRCRRWQNINP